jgi:streptogramin lyase
MIGVPSPETGQAIQGRVFGGQQPIVGAQVYLLAAATNGYGNKSSSLLTAGTGRTLDSSGGPTNGFYYVSTGSGGTFNISGDYTCTGGQQVYLYALSGSPGLPLGATNPAAGLLAALGTCPGTAGSTGNTFSSSIYVVMNEVSTIATAYALAGFATDAVHVSSSGTTLGLQGLANAFANVPNLETLGTGVATTSNVAGTGTVPQLEINTLANILASCVNSTGTVSGPTNPTACYTLFTNALSGGASGLQPTDTATAAINIAHYPGINVAALYGLSTASPPFASALTAQPNDFTIAIQITGNGLDEPDRVAIDGQGNVWTANSDGNSVSEFTNLGAVVANYTSANYGGLIEPVGVAIDGAGNGWISDFVVAAVTEISSTGVALSGSTGNGAISPSTLNDPNAIAMDASGNAWVADELSQNIVKVSNNGSNVYSFTKYSGSGMSDPFGIAIDGAGNVWTANYGSNRVVEMNSSGTVISGSGYTNGGTVNEPYDIAIDSAGNAFAPNRNNTLTILNNSGVAVGTSPFSGGGLSLPNDIALDGAGNAWISNYNNRISEFTNAGVAISPSTGYATSGSVNYEGIAVDGSGNVWISDGTYNPSLTELVGAAVPVITPIVAGLPSTPNVNGTSNLATRP